MSQSPGSFGNFMGNTVNSARPDRVKSRVGDHLPGRKGYANGGIQLPHNIQTNKQTKFVYLGRDHHRHTRPLCGDRVTSATNLGRYRSELYVQPTANLRLNVRMIAAKPVAALLHGSMTRSPLDTHRSSCAASIKPSYAAVACRKQNRTEHIMSFPDTLAKAECDKNRCSER